MSLVGLVLVPWTSPSVERRLTSCAAPAIAGGGGRGGVGRKHVERLLSSLHSIPGDENSPAAVDRLVRKFLLSCSKPAARVALSMYRRITGASWFRWNAKIAASVVPLLDAMGLYAEAEGLMCEADSRLKVRELVVFYCDLIEAYAKRGMREKVFEVRARLLLRGIPAGRGHEKGCGVMLDSGLSVDTICANMILSCYGDGGQLTEMVTWLRQMRDSNVPFSIRTCNSVLNSCPGLSSMLRDHQTRPLTLKKLMEMLEEEGCGNEETSLVQELVSSNVLLQTLDWSPSEGKLDLHGYHLCSAFLAVLLWIEELKARLLDRGAEGKVIPRQISIICGSGKHSNTMGESPVKRLVSVSLFHLGSPLRIDRKNVGRLMAGGTAVRDWLLKMEGS
ncbi:unnamed protein product [Spirodela intermedia]|uniref:Smr domain-containing protein n=1 Tax=Spirodela intermedia TaxID=51605 RepID=A0A7I8IWH8_SPIIN|nr:unnamed protein product [Spirodela intermedia]CAA6662337.1 unnamed protein product [Spirodela intermedia]